VKKALTWIAVIVAAIWVINNPDQAAALVQHIVHALTTLASKL
jgi:hypothetical protein